MKYTNTLPATDKELSKELIRKGGSKIKEPSNLTISTLISIPFMLVNYSPLIEAGASWSI